MSFQFNPIGMPFDLVGGGDQVTIPQYSEDPVSPNQEDVWVRAKVGLIPVLSHTLLHFGLTTTTELIETVIEYQLRYRTKENVTKGVILT